MKPLTPNKTAAKLSLNKLVRANGERLAARRKMSFSELVEGLLIQELRGKGIDPWDEQAPGEAPDENGERTPGR